MGLPFPPPIMTHRSESETMLELAVGYVAAVRDTFDKDDPAKSDEFLNIMVDFKNHKISVAEVASRVKVLFRDSPGLIAGFNTFLPDCYKILISADEFGARVVSQT